MFCGVVLRCVVVCCDFLWFVVVYFCVFWFDVVFFCVLWCVAVLETFEGVCYWIDELFRYGNINSL